MTKPLTFGVCAPSSYARPDRFEPGLKQLQDLGHKLIVHPQARGRLGETQSAGTVQEKLDAFYALLTNRDVDAIMFACGGNFSAHLLDKIDYDVVRLHAKPIIGYSDASALLNAIHAETGNITYHGPMLTSYRPEQFNAEAHTHLLKLIDGSVTSFDLPGSIIKNNGTGSGKLIGGNLAVFHRIMHTQYCPDTDGAILFFEDVGEELNRIDATLNHLRLLGAFKRARGLVFGQFTDLKDTGRPFGFTLEQIIATHTAGLNIPIITNAPFGHIGMFKAFPIGANVTLDAGQGTPTLTLAKPGA
jgi:muramoyltetrapeptide carboxypeptidase